MLPPPDLWTTLSTPLAFTFLPLLNTMHASWYWVWSLQHHHLISLTPLVSTEYHTPRRIGLLSSNLKDYCSWLCLKEVGRSSSIRKSIPTFLSRQTLTFQAVFIDLTARVCLDVLYHSLKKVSRSLFDSAVCPLCSILRFLTLALFMSRLRSGSISVTTVSAKVLDSIPFALPPHLMLLR